MKKRPVALVDVDDTLIFGVQNERLENFIQYNDTLLDALKQKGIRDIYLFTDMTLKIRGVKERLELVNYLKKNGFKVHGVITTNDISWGAILNNAIEQFISMPYEGGTWCGENFEAYVRDNQEQFYPALTTYRPQDCNLGRAFLDATRILRQNPKQPEFPKLLLQKSQAAKICGDHLGDKYNYPHTKGLLLDIFIHNPPNWVSEIVVVDDNAKVCETIKNFKSTNENLQVPDITLIEINRRNTEDKGGYEAFDRKYRDLNKELISSIVREISDEITRLQFGWNPFKSTSKYKIKALESLIELIKSPSTEVTNVGTIINQWKENNTLFTRSNGGAASVNEVISQKRGFFSCNESTKTLQFTNKLKRKYGSRELQLDGDLPLNLPSAALPAQINI